MAGILNTYCIVWLSVTTVFLALSSPCHGEEDKKITAYRVTVELKTNASFTAVVKDSTVLPLIEKGKSLDLKRFEPDFRLTLYYMRGMNGTMVVRLKDVRSIEGVEPLIPKALENQKADIERRIKDIREKEKKRLAKKEASKKQQSKKAKEEATKKESLKEEEKRKKKEAERFKWLNRFPPEKGWGPEKKKALYRRSIAIGVYPNEEEQAFLDHFETWLEQFGAWKILEEKKAREKEEEKSRNKNKEEKEQSESGKEEKGGR